MLCMYQRERKLPIQLIFIAGTGRLSQTHKGLRALGESVVKSKYRPPTIPEDSYTHPHPHP